jgi:Na+/H+ antiporter NhaD/arsenite permease-like protein
MTRSVGVGDGLEFTFMPPHPDRSSLIIADITAKTTILRCIAVEAVGRAQGRPHRLLVATSVITAVVSAFSGLIAAAEGIDLAAPVVIWMSGVVSAVVDNVAYAMTFVPLVEQFGGAMHASPLIWALALGANLPDTTTVFSASVIVVIASLSHARGALITLLRRVRRGVPRAVAKVFVGETDIWLRYEVLLS